jgi:hypothetical protein
MAGFTAGEGGTPKGAPFKLGPYTFDWANPISYLIAWALATLVAIALAAVVPGLAVAFAAMVLFGTLIGLANLRRG